MLERLRGLTISKSAAIGIVLVLALMPWFQGGRDPIGWMVLLGVAVIGSYILWSSPLKVSLDRLGLVWLGFVGWTGLSLIWSVNRYQSVISLMLYLFVGIIFTLAFAVADTQAVRLLIRQAYLLLAAITSLVGIIFYIFYSYDRATSTFYLPNPLAAFLLPAIIIGLWQFAERRRLSDALVTMLTLGTLVLTDSRGAALVLIIIIFIALILSRHMAGHWRRLLIVVVGAIALALLVNLARAQLTHHFKFQGERFKQITSSESSSTSDRIYYLNSALAIWADRPLLGGGAGSFGTLHPKYQYRVISAGDNVHNFYVQTLAELGVIGLGLLVWVIFVLGAGIIRGIKHDPSRLPLALGLVGLLLHAAIDLDNAYPVLWALAAILAALCYLPKASDKRLVGRLPGIILIGSLVLAIPTSWLFRAQTSAAVGQDSQSIGDSQHAIIDYQAATAHPPYDPNWLTGAGINYYLLSTTGEDKGANLAKALKLAQEAERLDPFEAQNDFLMARVYLAQDNPVAAEAAYHRAIAKDPYDQPDYYNDLATLYLAQNKIYAAQSTANVVLELYSDAAVANRNNDAQIAPSVATSYAIVAQTKVKQGQLDAARSLISHALKLDTTNAAAKLLLQQIGQ